MTIRIFLVLLLLAGAAALGAFLSVPEKELPADAAEGPSVERLIKDLGSPRFRTREEASRKLREIGERALPALRKGAASDDLETRRRCQRLLDEIEVRTQAGRERMLIAKVEAKWAEGGLKDFLKKMARFPAFQTPDYVRDCIELGHYVAIRASQVSGRKFRAPALDATKLPIATEHSGPFYDQAVFGSIADDYTNCLAVHIGGAGNLRNSIVFVCGSGEGGVGIFDSIVVCLGDLGHVTSMRNSVILVAGRFEGITDAQGCFIEVGELGTGTYSTNTVYVSPKKAPAILRNGNRILAGPGPLEFFLSDGRRPPPAKGQAAGKK
jgi:hypothetical protein